MSNIDYTKAFIALADGTEWQVLDADGEMDPVATQNAIDAYMAA